MGILREILPSFLFGWYHQLWPFLGAAIYGFPAYSAGRPHRKIKVIGITGTNGKTTVTHLATDILEGAGYKVASISSLRFKIGEREWRNELKMTMPGRMKIQKFLRQTVNEGCEYVVMEVTSEGIKQHRHKFIDFDVAVFTNLTPEHIESHGSFENYKKAKGELFKRAKTAIVNLDDENAEYFLDFDAKKKYVYGIVRVTKRGQTPQAGSDPDRLKYVEARDIQLHGSSMEFLVDELRFNLNLLGRFNVYNALAAVCVGLSQGIDIEAIKKALERFKGVPGRMEVVVREPFTVIVDYAHTPDALQKVYKTVREGYKLKAISYKLVCVLGAAGGGRDKWKRPEMGKIAAKYCDEIILTNEDPYDENPASILEQIEAGFSEIRNPKHEIRNYTKILDRKEAIKKALEIANPGDVAIITGKGAEPWMMTKEGRIPWDDRKIVRETIKKIQS